MKKYSKKHPGPDEIRKAILTGQIPFRDHLKECEVCRDIFMMMQEFAIPSDFSLERPVPEAIRRFHSIRLLASKQSYTDIKSGIILFDSWAGAPRHQIRDSEPGLIRSLCLKADEVTFDFVCERIQKGWAFTGRVFEFGDAVMHWILQVGNKKILPKSLGYYHWTSNRSPRTIRLLSSETRIDFAKVDW